MAVSRPLWLFFLSFHLLFTLAFSWMSFDTKLINTKHQKLLWSRLPLPANIVFPGCSSWDLLVAKYPQTNSKMIRLEKKGLCRMVLDGIKVTWPRLFYVSELICSLMTLLSLTALHHGEHWSMWHTLCMHTRWQHIHPYLHAGACGRQAPCTNTCCFTTKSAVTLLSLKLWS